MSVTTIATSRTAVRSPLILIAAPAVQVLPIKCVYLYHFAEPIGNEKHTAQHYLGFAEDLLARDTKHRSGRGAAITRAVVAQGIDLVLVRTWNGADRTFERKLKNYGRSLAHFCPHCSGAAAFRRGVYTPAACSSGPILEACDQAELEHAIELHAGERGRTDWYQTRLERDWRSGRSSGAAILSEEIDLL